MSKYVIDGSTLSAIGDAIRVKTETTELIMTEEMASKILGITTGGGESGGGGGETPATVMTNKKISRTSNMFGFNILNGYPVDWDSKRGTHFYDVVTIPGAVSLKMKISVLGYYFMVYAQSGNVGNDTDFTDTTNINTSYIQNNASSMKFVTKEVTFADTDTLTIKYEYDYYTSSSDVLRRGYYAEIVGYDADGNEITFEDVAPAKMERAMVCPRYNGTPSSYAYYHGYVTFDVADYSKLKFNYSRYWTNGSSTITNWVLQAKYGYQHHLGCSYGEEDLVKVDDNAVDDTTNLMSGMNYDIGRQEVVLDVADYTVVTLYVYAYGRYGGTSINLFEDIEYI